MLIYNSGNVFHTPHERFALLDLLESCQKRIHRPLASLRKEPDLSYSKHALMTW